MLNSTGKPVAFSIADPVMVPWALEGVLVIIRNRKRLAVIIAFISVVFFYDALSWLITHGVEIFIEIEFRVPKLLDIGKNHDNQMACFPYNPNINK